MKDKSPFFVVPNFISPMQCEDIISRLRNYSPDVDENDVPVKTIRTNALTEIRLLPALEELIPQVEDYFGFTHLGILPFKFEWFVEGFKDETAACDNSDIRDGKWSRCNDTDFTAIIFLNEYNEAVPFDTDFEVYGGKLEFPTHRFGFNPQRGMLVFFPAGPNFVHGTSKILVGELTQIRINFVATERYTYNIKNFPGNYKTWFKNL